MDNKNLQIVKLQNKRKFIIFHSILSHLSFHWQQEPASNEEDVNEFSTFQWLHLEIKIDVML